MVLKLLQAAEGHWRAVNGPHLVALVRAGARFEAGKLIERPDQTPDEEADEDVTKVAA
jgi:putative transposase